MGKKLSSLALCLVFLLGLMPHISLLAAKGTTKKPTQVTVGDTMVFGKYTDKGATEGFWTGGIVPEPNVGTGGKDITGGYWTTGKSGKLTACDANDDWNVRYDDTTHTLYLNGAIVKRYLQLGNISHVICSDGDLRIIIKGYNTINTINTMGTEGIPLYVRGNLTIDSDKADESSSLALVGSGFFNEGTRTSLFVENSLSILNGHITTSDNEGFNCNGVMVQGDIDLHCGSLTVETGKQAKYSVGVESGGNVTVQKGAKIKASVYGTGNSVGVKVAKNLIVNGGIVDGVAGDVTLGGAGPVANPYAISAGVDVEGILKVTDNGSVIGTAGDTTGFAYGICAKNYEIIHGILNGSSGKVTDTIYDGSYSYGVYSESTGSIIFKAGQIIAKSAGKIALDITLPKTGFYYRTKEGGEWKLGPNASFDPGKLEYAELFSNLIAVNLDANNSTGTMEDAYLLVNMDETAVTLPVPENKFTKDGYKFTGWKRSDNGEIVQPGARLEIAMKDLPSGFKLTAQWEKYTITEGADSTWEKGSGKDFTIKSNAPFENFKEVQVDGKTLAKDNYTAKDGSTIITLKSAYLETLSAGEHTISIVYTDGSKTDAKVTVKEKEVVKTSDEPKDTNTDGNKTTNKPKDTSSNNNNIPQTGDAANLLPVASVAVLSVGAFLAMIIITKKKKSDLE